MGADVGLADHAPCLRKTEAHGGGITFDSDLNHEKLGSSSDSSQQLRGERKREEEDIRVCSGKYIVCWFLNSP